MTPAGGSALSMTYTGTNSSQRTSAGTTAFANSLFGVASSTTGSTSTYFTHGAGGGLSSILVGSTRAIVFHPSFGGAAGPAGSGFSVIVRRPSHGAKGHDRPETGSGPFVSGVGARLDRCLPWERNSRPARRSQGAAASRARSERRWWSRARRGDGEVGRHRGASSQRPLMPMPRSDHRPLCKIRRSQRDDPALPGVRVTLAAAKVTLVGTGVTLERTWIGPRVTFGRRCTSRRVTFDRHLALLRMTFRVTSFRIMNGAGARCPGFE